MWMVSKAAMQQPRLSQAAPVWLDCENLISL